MPIQKPAPLMIGGKAHYTLSSTDPIEVEVVVPFVTDEEVGFAVASIVRQAGGEASNLQDDAWVSEHFQGIENGGQLMEAVRLELRQSGIQGAEESKANRCLAALVSRLGQSVPSSDIAETREALEAEIAQQAKEAGLSLDSFLMQQGVSRAQFEDSLDRQAQAEAEVSAALDAFASTRKLTVEDGEFEHYLSIPAKDLEPFVNQARHQGFYDEIRDAALRNKAMETVVAECSCSYHHETKEEAAERVKKLTDALDAASAGQTATDATDEGSDFSKFF